MSTAPQTRAPQQGGGSQRRIAMGAPAIGEEEIAAVTEVLRSGMLREGERTRAFEAAFAEAEGAAWAVACSSGTAALQLAYLATLQPGDEVLVPGFGFIATASMVVAIGGVPVFCDIDPETFAITPEEVDRRCTKKTRACVPVHLYGHPAPIEELQLICRERGLRIIWDAAQAHGATWQGQRMGAFPDLATYSLYASKNITTGEGGVIVGHDPALRTRLLRLKNHGSEPGGAAYDHRQVGYNFRLTDMAAAIGLVQLEKLDGLSRARRLNASRLTRHLTGLPGLRVPVERPGAVSVYHQYTIVLDLERLKVDRREFASRLADRGIASSVHYPLPMHHQPALSQYCGDAVLPNSVELARRVLSLPVHPALTTDDVDRVALAVRDVHDEVLR